MAIVQVKDIEDGGNKGLEDLEHPLLQCHIKHEEASGSMGMVFLSTFVAVSGAFEFGSCVGYSAPTQSSIREDLNLTIAQFSMFGSIVTIGAMFGAITSGRIADFIGRKGAMRLSAAFCIVGWLTVYLAMGALSLDMGRFLTGYGIGIFSYVVPVFIAEIAPRNVRGGLTTLNQLMIVVGGSVTFLIGAFVTWRTLAIIGIVPCIVLLVGLFFIPESPRWLAKLGLQKEFEAALRRLRGKNAHVSGEAAEIQAYIESLHTLPKARMLDLFEAKYIRPVVIAIGLMIFQQMGGINGISFYASETFVEVAGPSTGKIGTVAYGIIQVPITLVGAILMDKSGRRPLLMVSSTGTFCGCFLAGTAFLLKGQNLMLEWVPILAVSGVLLYIASFSIGMGAVPWVIMSEIFPIHIKGIAGSLVVLVNWLGAWAVSYTFNFLMSWSSTGTFFLFSGFSALTVLFVAKIVPETKGKTLEEIQASINCLIKSAATRLTWEIESAMLNWDDVEMWKGY